MARVHTTLSPATSARTEARCIHHLEHLCDLPRTELRQLAQVTRHFPFRASNYYLGLIDWSDPADPIRRLIVPNRAEVEPWGTRDASHEQDYTVAPGVQHKYPSTVLFLCSSQCGGLCRYCFRKRLFGAAREHIKFDIVEALAYVAARPQVSNVLLTGGDPLMLPTGQLSRIIASLWEIPHVRIIRIGSKMPAFDPDRIGSDHELLQTLDHYGSGHARIQVMTHFDHPRELTPRALCALQALHAHGVATVNQCPISAGINDDPLVLRALFEALSYANCPQYYAFAVRPTAGNKPFRVPLVRAYELFGHAIAGIPGLAKTARLVMSHASGKIEIVGLDSNRIYLRYHRAFAPADRGRFFACRRDDNAFWLDDLQVDNGIAAAC
ncbi:MAG: radical SAM protein [Armatimonadetes bacterium]|nr:radical SAM protein [Armatimonadota bacterium]